MLRITTSNTVTSRGVLSRIWAVCAMAAVMALGVESLDAKDYYVSAARGKGKKGTKDKPAKDLGNIIKKLEPGDVVHIAGGTYLGRGKNGSDVITVPVSILGGYDDTFTTRDPWGEHKTILSGENKSKNWVATPRLMIDLMKYKGKDMPEILVDGVIVDHSGRNQYKTEARQEIVRKANPKLGTNPTPDMGGLVIRASKTGNFDAEAHWKITVQNCVVINTAPTQGALSVSGYKGSKIAIRNNLIANNTGSGIVVGTKFHGKDGAPTADLSNNTVLFTWKYDPFAQSFSGNSVKVERGVVATMTKNVFAFADRFGLHNAGNCEMSLYDNLIVGNVEADYLEFDTRIALEDIEDESDYVEEAEDNVGEKIAVAVPKAWAEAYGSRVLVDRNAVEADIQAQKSAANELRSMLGLPLQAGHVDAPQSPVWLPVLSVEDSISAIEGLAGERGCKRPGS